MAKLAVGQIWTPDPKISTAWPREIMDMTIRVESVLSRTITAVYWNYVGANRLAHDIPVTGIEFYNWINRNNASS